MTGHGLRGPGRVARRAPAFAATGQGRASIEGCRSANQVREGTPAFGTGPRHAARGEARPTIPRRLSAKGVCHEFDAAAV